MLGILSSMKKREKHIQYFSHLLNVLNKYHNELMFAFTIEDIDFSNKMVCGDLISKDGIEKEKVPIPPFIFNVTHYKKRSSVNNVIKLALHTGAIIVNGANKFKQNMIMEMLSSNVQTKDILMQYETPMKNDMEKYKDERFFILDDKGEPFSNTNHFSDKKKLIIFDKQDLLLFNNNPIIITLYLQRGVDGLWEALPGTEIHKDICAPDTLVEKLKSTAIDLIMWVNCFIPNLGFSTVKLVLDKYFNPYLISLNGWDSKILRRDTDYEIGANLLENLFGYRCFLNKRGGVCFVD